MSITKLKKKWNKKKEELRSLSSKFKELKSLIYDYRDKKEEEIRDLNNDHFKLKKKSKKNKKIMKN